jgi:hypothetical protein
MVVAHVDVGVGDPGGGQRAFDDCLRVADEGIDGEVGRPGSTSSSVQPAVSRMAVAMRSMTR